MYVRMLTYIYIYMYISLSCFVARCSTSAEPPHLHIRLFCRSHGRTCGYVFGSFSFHNSPQVHACHMVLIHKPHVTHHDYYFAFRCGLRPEARAVSDACAVVQCLSYWDPIIDLLLRVWLLDRQLLKCERQRAAQGQLSNIPCSNYATFLLLWHRGCVGCMRFVQLSYRSGRTSVVFF